MSRFLYRLGGSAAAHPWRTICAWFLVLATAFAIAGTLGGTPRDVYDVPGAEAQVGLELLREHAPEAAGAQATVVVHDPDGSPLPAAVLSQLGEQLSSVEHVSHVTAPRLSEDADTALVMVRYEVPVTDPDIFQKTEPLEAATASFVDAGLQVELGGELPESASQETDGRGELVGVGVALALLVLTFGSVVSAGLPLAVAFFGLAFGTAGVTLLAALTDVSTSAPMVATMVGLGVGIDYALLLVTRHVEYLHQGLDVRTAAARACATAGRSVVFASSTVLVSLMGLRLSGLAVYASFGFATAIVVVAVMAAALTLVPALCGLAGQRVMPRSVRRHEPRRVGPSATERWATRIGRRPLAWALAATVVMLTLAAPTLAMRTWPQDSSTQSQEITTRRAYDLVAEEFGAGANASFTVVADRSQVSDATLADVTSALAVHPDIAEVGSVQMSADAGVAIVEFQPEFGPADERTGALVDELRSDVLPEGVELTGQTPFFADIADLLSERLPVVIGFVVAVSVVLLAMMFRSIVVPIKAALMNVLSIGAAYGVVTAVFQWGWGVELLGLDQAVPVSSWLPILMFAILFGLSMDYEVFLLSRVREDWDATGDARGSVVRGLGSTGRVISAAAAIMVAVFLGFATEADVVVKMMGFGMAVAIFLDATVIRMVLVPATMALLGHRNWWLPAWLDRLLPTVRAEIGDEELRVPAAPAPADAQSDDDRVPAGV